MCARWLVARIKSAASKKRKAADQLLHYVCERREMILYPKFRTKAGRSAAVPPNPSANSPSTASSRSRRWDRPNAIAVTALDSLRRSGQWNIYFQTPCQLPP